MTEQTKGGQENQAGSSPVLPVMKIPLDKIKVGENLARLYPVPKARITVLAADILANGLLNPLTVVEQGEEYRLVAGGNRYAALRLIAGKTGDREMKIPCTVSPAVDEKGMFLTSFSENHQRQNLSPSEIARAIRTFRQLNGLEGEKNTRKVKELMGFGSVTEVTQHERLLRLSGVELKQIHTGYLTAEGGFDLARIPDLELRARLLAKAARIEVEERERELGRTVKDLEAVTAQTVKVKGKMEKAKLAKARKELDGELKALKARKGNLSKKRSRLSDELKGTKLEARREMTQVQKEAVAKGEKGAASAAAKGKEEVGSGKVKVGSKSVRKAAASLGARVVKTRNVKEWQEILDVMKEEHMPKGMRDFAAAWGKWWVSSGAKGDQALLKSMEACFVKGKADPKSAGAGMGGGGRL